MTYLKDVAIIFLVILTNILAAATCLVQWYENEGE